MASERKRETRMVPTVWLIGTIAMSFGAGISVAHHTFWWIIFAICAIGCAIALTRLEARVNKRMRFVIDATLSGDFSYKFPVSEVSQEERKINEMLNLIVEHFESMTREIRQNEVFLGRLINLTDIGLAVADANGDVRLHNEAALRLLDRKALTNICQIPEHAYADLDINKSPVTVNDRSFTLFTFSDLSRKMQAVEVESWEKLTRVLTHEIMNSLTPIQSIAETMSGKDTPREATEAFRTISSSSRSLMQFVRNFREFSRLPEPTMKAIYLKPILEQCVRMAESYTKDTPVIVTLTCFPAGLMVYTDESLLSQVLLNIMKNAVEANPRHISVEAEEKTDESVEIRISNDGEPIPDETAGHIFTPFFTTRESGSGIGLSLSRRIITHLGGTLTFKTRPITSFSVRI